MHTTIFATLLSLPLLVLSSPVESSWTPQSSDYYSLGCPKSTKPHASQREQTSVLNTFANLVFVKHDVVQGYAQILRNLSIVISLLLRKADAQQQSRYNTYAAKNFINNAPESQKGRRRCMIDGMPAFRA